MTQTAPCIPEYLTLMEACAWIMLRSEDAVRWANADPTEPAYRSEEIDRVIGAWSDWTARLNHRGTTRFDLAVRWGAEGEALRLPEKPESELVARLRSGQLQSWRRDNITGALSFISSSEWRRVRLGDDPDAETELCVWAADVELREPVIRNAVVLFADLLTFWPETTNHRRFAGRPTSRPETEAEMHGRASTKEKQKGTRRSSGLDYSKQDAPIIAKMHEMIQAGAARNPTDAARALAKSAVGGGKEASKVTRLLQRYLHIFSPVQD